MKLRLMADCDCSPIWEELPDGVRNVPVQELPVSADLRDALTEWAAVYDRTLRRDDPGSSGFSSEEAERAFEANGRALWKRLRDELDETSRVSYFSQTERRELK